MALACPLLVGLVLAGPMAAQLAPPQQQSAAEQSLSDMQTPVNWLQQFVPDSRAFWDNSLHWTTNYGPAYRDTMEQPTQMLACSGQFALCFHSGADPYPCRLSADGRSANCVCTVQSSTNYVLLTSILNYSVYLATYNSCGQYGTGCAPNKAPVCKFLDGSLNPGSDVISTFDPESRSEIIKAIASGNAGTTPCTGAYAACMTAPCRNNGDGTANCKCPVFYGKFQLTGKGQACTLGDDLVPSASYSTLLDKKGGQ